jgi:N-acetylglutamate synthase-like GNAT family acetyltransferase
MRATVRKAAAEDAPWIRDHLTAQWGGAVVVSRGRALDASALPAFVAETDGRPAGLLTYRPDGDECQLVTLDAAPRLAGTGSALVEALTAEARAAGWARIWLITTNDNLDALRFYQRRGFRLAALHRDALAESRRLKPQIPLVGDHGIEIRDELELELRP